MQDDPSPEKSHNINSKNVKPQKDENKIDLELGKLEFVILKKPLSILFLAEIILIVVFALGAVIFVVVYWESISPNLNENKIAISPHKLNEVSSKHSKSLSFDRNLTSHGDELNENHQEEHGSLSTYLFFDGTQEADDSSTMTSFDDHFAAFGNSYESTVESFFGTVSGTMATEQAKGQFCEEISFSSSGVVKELYPNLFGVYGAVGMLKDNLVYKHKHTNSVFFFWPRDRYQLGNKEFETQWSFVNQDYVAYGTFCEDLSVSINSKCTPEWLFCTIDSQIPNSWRSAEPLFRHTSKSFAVNCSLDATVLVQCNKDKLATKLINDDNNGHTPFIEDSSLPQRDTDSDFICAEFEFSSSKVQESNPILGIYSIEDYHYKDKVVYVNKQTGVYFYFGSPFHSTTTTAFNFTTKTVIHTNTIHRLWGIGYSTDDSDFLAENLYCANTDFPANGDCEIGWFYLDTETNSFKSDYTASIVCREPTPMEDNQAARSLCTKFELTTKTAFEFGNLVLIIGEYEITNTTYNGKLAYHKFDSVTMSPFYLYFDINKAGRKVWKIGSEIGIEGYVIINFYCIHLEHRVTKECNAGWYYFHTETRKWEYDFDMALQCTEFL